MSDVYNINSQFTLLERYKRCGPAGSRIQPVLDVMDKLGVPAFLRDVPYFPATHGLKNRTVRTTSRPASTRRKFYQGVERTALTTQVVWDDIVLYEQRSELDEDHVDTVENGSVLRGDEDRAHAAGVLEDAVNAIFNDAPTSGAEYIDGFANRANIISYPGHSTETLPYCWEGGGSTNLSSIYVIDWGKLACHMIYPTVKGGKMGVLGVDVRNKGKEPKPDTDSSTATYYIYVTQFKKWCGLCMADDRKWFRVANINSVAGGSNTFDENILIRAIRHSRINIGTSRMYVNPYIAAQMDIRLKDKSNVHLTVEQVFGEPVLTFRKIPIRVLDETILDNDETEIT